MTLRAVMTTGAPTAEEKRQALKAVLQTVTFSRSGQLRNFLSFICEMELGGRAAEISEYLIGVEALGRPPGYSTTDDSTVRRHAHALRQKLEEVYAGEAAGATLRIELPKGTYVPRYVPLEPSPVRPSGEEARPSAPPAREEARPAPRHVPWLWLAAGVAAGVLLALPFALRRDSAKGPEIDAVLREAWAPFHRPESNPLICISSPPHIGILPYPDEGALPDEVDELAEGKDDLIAWYRERYPLAAGQRLATHLATGPLRLGEVFALVAAIKMFDHFSVPFEFVVEKNVEVPALRGRNLLLLANPEYSFAAEKLMERAAWTVGYDPVSRRRVVRPTSVHGAEQRTFLAPAGAGIVYGLVTVLPSDGTPDASHKTVVISCTNSAGCHAAMELFASPPELRALRERLRGEGHAGFPPAYQVVVKCRVYKTQAMSWEYAGHTVLR
jgi:hypothetical protein